MQQDRHLAAILFTDIVGYTAMMQKDEAQALATVRRHNGVVQGCCKAHGGEVVNFYGDGCLAVFHSATEAVQCALDIQNELRNTPMVPVRIGLHLGEIFFEEGKVIGDGVNVASRVQSLGIGNSILVSSVLQHNIKNHTEFKTVPIGKYHFKNVDEPMEVFALANEGLAVPKPDEMHGKLKDTPQKTGKFKWIAAISFILMLVSGFAYFFNQHNTQKKTESADYINVRSIAVLPFDDYSPQKDQAWFTDGMTDALITELSKISSLSVRSRTSVMQYKGTQKTIPEIAKELNVDAVIEGSALKAGDSVRITAQLINADDKHLWANNFDAGMEDVLRLHHDIARAITNGINLVLTPTDAERFTQPSKVNPAALESDLKGTHIYSTGKGGAFGTGPNTLEELQEAIRYFKDAIATDSTFAQAYAHLAESYLSYPVYGEMNPVAAWKLAEGPNNTALQLDPQSVLGYLNQFFYLYYIRWGWEDGLKALSKAQELAPNNPELLFILNHYYVISGKFDQAMEVCDKIYQNNPSEVTYWQRKAWTQIHSRRFEEALRTSDDGLKRFPDNIGLLYYRGLSLSLMQRHEEAVTVCRKWLSLLKGTSLLDHAVAGWIFARAGYKTEALKELDFIKGLKIKYNDPAAIGMVYMALGEKNRVMEYFQKGSQEHSRWVPFLKRSPVFDAMRDDPAFEKLIRDLKFP